MRTRSVGSGQDPPGRTSATAHTSHYQGTFKVLERLFVGGSGSSTWRPRPCGSGNGCAQLGLRIVSARCSARGPSDVCLKFASRCTGAARVQCENILFLGGGWVPLVKLASDIVPPLMGGVEKHRVRCVRPERGGDEQVTGRSDHLAKRNALLVTWIQDDTTSDSSHAD